MSRPLESAVSAEDPERHTALLVRSRGKGEWKEVKETVKEKVRGKVKENVKWLVGETES